MRKNNFKIFAILSMIIIFYNEVLVYWQSYLNWPQLHKKSLFYHKNGSLIKNINERPVRLLLVADPQLIGENDEPFYLSWIARWDCDRYLRSGFALANSYTNPDATIYLGDLFDEGLKSTDAQVERYYYRFKKIFKIDIMSKIHGVKQIFISGDNDIGGEYFGDRNNRLEARFENYFGRNIDLIQLNSFIKFLKLDLDSSNSFYRGKKREYIKELINMRIKNKNGHKNFTILLNHGSLLDGYRKELNNLNKDSSAGLIIKGDNHLFEIKKLNYLTQIIEKYINYETDSSNFYKMDLDSDENENGATSIYELSIPTCSYRMGVPNMGYGVLTITPNGKAYASILWLPSRFNCIKLYLFYLVIVFCFYMFNFIIKKAYKKVYFVISDKISNMV